MNELLSGQEQPAPATYFEQGTYPSEGARVTIVSLGDTRGMLIARKHMSVRRSGVSGTTLSYAAGHGGDVWFVEHDSDDEHKNSEVGAYTVAEIAPLPTDEAEQQ